MQTQTTASRLLALVFEGHSIRTVLQDGKPLFVAKDVFAAAEWLQSIAAQLTEGLRTDHAVTPPDSRDTGAPSVSPMPARHSISSHGSLPSAHPQESLPTAGTRAAKFREALAKDPVRKASGASSAGSSTPPIAPLADYWLLTPPEDQRAFLLAAEALRTALCRLHHPTAAPPTSASKSTPPTSRESKRARKLLRAALAQVAPGGGAASSMA